MDQSGNNQFVVIPSPSDDADATMQMKAIIFLVTESMVIDKSNGESRRIVWNQNSDSDQSSALTSFCLFTECD